MRALSLSDIHANLEPLESVIADAETRGGFDALWCLGDTVGYGANPNACLACIRAYDLLAVAENHDTAAVGLTAADDFNGAAKAAALWTAGQLATEENAVLAGLPLVARADSFTLVHGSLRDPLVEYLLDQGSALATLTLLDTKYCLVGHSRYPFICRENSGFPAFTGFPEGEVTLLGDERLILNPGGVGQPRDHDPRPSYAIYDSDAATVERHRVEYDIAKTQDKIRRAGLPERLAERLSHDV